MKLTDLAIIFQVFFLCLLLTLHIRSNKLHCETVNEIMYNNVMDGIVEDALNAGYKSIDKKGNPVVDLNEVKRCFEAEKELYNSTDRHILLYVETDGFFLWDNELSNIWEEKVIFSAGGDTLHEKKVYELMEYINARYSISLYLPFSEGEAYINTVEEYSLLILSFNRNYEIKCFSGAKIHKK